MMIAKDQFLSWEMVTARESSWRHSPGAWDRYSFFRARDAIYHSLSLLEIPREAQVLVPSYVCRAAIDPILAYHAQVRFYAITRNCEPDFPDLEQQITPQTKAIVVVHYFGFPQPIVRIRDLCKRYNLALIEDCAHVLCGEIHGEPMGSFGDASVFSWRKFLPVYDGGELIMNQPARLAEIEWIKESPLFTLKVAVNMLEQSLAQSQKRIPRLFYKGFRTSEASIRRCVGRYLQRAHGLSAANVNVPLDEQGAGRRMSRLSRLIKAHSDIPLIIARRRRNYEILLEQLSSLTGVTPLFPHLPPTVCPWVFPAFFSDLPDAHVKLQRCGVPAVAWDGVRHPLVPKSADLDLLYNNLVFLPVHQTLTEKNLKTVAMTVRDVSMTRKSC